MPATAPATTQLTPSTDRSTVTAPACPENFTPTAIFDVEGVYTSDVYLSPVFVKLKPVNAIILLF
jgi:hypothetical protein